MAHIVHFTKMHGAGNDYIYVDTTLYHISDPSAAAIAWSDRHKGIGSDGLVLIGQSPIPEADFSMRIFNADGSEAMMCGNASRCIGKYLYDKGLTAKTEIRLLTLSGVKVLHLHLSENKVESVTVDMGEPVFENPEQFLPSYAKELSTSLPHREGPGVGLGFFVSMGNPHYVIFTDDINSIDVAEEGRRLEYHKAFPERCNIEFAQLTAPGVIRTRVWERGSGITMACGTGACATAVAAAISGRCGRKSTIVMDGGELEIAWEDNNRVSMTGPAAFVFEGDVELETD